MRWSHRSLLSHSACWLTISLGLLVLPPLAAQEETLHNYLAPELAILASDKPAAAAPAAKTTPAPAKDSAEPKVIPFWEKNPPVPYAIARAGWFLVPPTGPGYYSLQDVLTDTYREAPPKFGNVRFSLMQFPFFDTDWRYLEKPDNKDTDYLDCLKRIHIGDSLLLTTGGDFRIRYNNEVGSRLTGLTNTYELLRTRAYADLWYEDRFRIYGEMIDSRSFNEDLPRLPTDETRLDILNLFADVKVCEVKDEPVYVRIGRQELFYGSQRLISPIEWANTRRTFQGIKAFRHSEKFDVDLFCVQPIFPQADALDSVDNDMVFTGLYTTYRPTKTKTIDAFFLNLDDTRPGVTREGPIPGPFNVSTVAGRYHGEQDNFLYDLEGALQFGEQGSQSILANAVTAAVGYVHKQSDYRPTFWINYDYASGDDRPGVGGVSNTFNQLYPFGHYYFGYADVIGRVNIHDISVQASFYPTKWITALVQFHVFRLDSPFDALYSVAGTPTRRDPTGQAGTEVGEEVDFLMNFHLSKHSDILFSYSHLFPGSFLARTGSGRPLDVFYLQYTYRW